MEKLVLGQTEKVHQRGVKDAFHVPCVTVICYDLIKPGDSVRFLDCDCKEVRKAGKGEERHGIVDPFLDKPIHPFSVFNVMLEPSIVGKTLRHEFDINHGLPEPEPEPEDSYHDSCRGCY